jgi:cellulose synthase/poly-beta-1,6-N-acetylglucosamine synthase-like glycosyltransferase
MAIVFSIAVFWIAYVYFGYPCLLWVLGRFRRVQPMVSGSFLPSVSVLVSARNEQTDIGWKVRETLAWDYPVERLEMLVASDASDDHTDDILRSFSDPRLTFVRMPKRSGKGAALNRLVPLAKGELLLFTDVNTHIPPDCLRKLTSHFADERVGCVTGGTELLQDKAATVVSTGGSAFLGYEGMLNRLESRMGSVLVCDGAIFCIRRSLFSPLSADLANDLELPMRIAHGGRSIVYEPAARALERDTSSPWESFSQRRRIAAQGLLAMWRLRETLHGLRGWQFVSRKFLRWLTLVPLLLLLIASVGLASGRWFALTAMLEAIFVVLALAGLLAALRSRRGGRLMSIPFFILLGSAATFTGCLDACRGRRFAVWETPTLSRGSAAD